MLPALNIGPPVVNQVQTTREELPLRYQQLLIDNPLLGRIEGSCRTIAWTDLEIRTIQLITAVQSNASLQARLRELEQSLAKKS